MRRRRELGRYEILEQIGRGGMAIVYLARQVDLDRLVAVKELASPGSSSDPAWAARFLRESRLAGSLTHANIVTVFDYFELDGTPYIAMEYLERGSLRQWVGTLTLAQTIGVLEDVLAGLEHAATSGIVHRDLKPENLLVTADGRIKITDFGIAKAVDRLQTGEFDTAEGITVGTPAYMAPEQAMGRALGPGCDLYAVGCMAFELVTGRLPYQADAPMALLLQHVSDPVPSARSVSPDVSEGLSAWIAGLMTKDPDDRPDSPAAVWEELEEIVLELLGPRWRRESGLGLEAGSPPSSQRHTSTHITGFPAYTPPPALPVPEPAPPHETGADDEFITFIRDGTHPVPLPSWDPPPASVDPAPLPEARPVPSSRPPPTTAVRPVPGPYTPPPSDSDFASVFTPAARSEPAAFEAPLTADFQYLHGPLVVDEGGVELLGNRRIVRKLKERLIHSRGGSFLVTGFRGVGKTTIVLRALDELEAAGAAPVEFVPIVLNVARPMSVDQLLFEVMRRLFEALTDRGVLERLEPDIRQAMLLAYARTFFNLKETAAHSRETSQSFNVDVAKLMPVGVGPKLGVSRKRAESLGREATFLAYSHADVEHDFLRIVSLLDVSGTVVPTPARRFRRRPPPPWRGRLVVVLDELDKLTADQEGIDAVREMLMSLKNLLTARNVHFVFVGGPELHDEFVRDVARGNSVYESVFAYHLYVPCLWASSRLLVSKVVQGQATSDALDELVQYFDFKARGIPRLLLRELNSFVHWSGDEARLRVSELEAIRVRFYARIQQAVDDFVANAIDRQMRTMEIDEDRWRLGACYITDWILRRGPAEFTIADILEDESKPSPLMHASPERVERLVRHLVGHGIVDKVWYQDVDNTLVGDASQANSFRLRASVIEDLAKFAQRNEIERAEQGSDQPGGAAPWATVVGTPRLKQGRYERGDLIAIGGVGRVYRGIDLVTGREVAIKLLAEQYLGDHLARGRWRRETEIAMQLRHEHIVRTYEVVEEGSVAAIVMELIDGPTLRDVLPLQSPAAVIVACQLLTALEAAHASGLARFDIKPENIVFRNRSSAVIVDLGLVKRMLVEDHGFATFAATHVSAPPVGTPAYMSPEQAAGSDVDIRSDLYCVAVVLYETIVGRKLRDVNGTLTEVLLRVRREPADPSELTDISDELRAVVTRALAHDPGDRYQTPEDMRIALLRTPEGEDGGQLPDAQLLTPRRPPGGGFGVYRAPRKPRPSDRPDDEPPADGEADAERPAAAADWSSTS